VPDIGRACLRLYSAARAPTSAVCTDMAPEMRTVRTILTICASHRHDVRMADRDRDERLIEFVRAHGTATVEALSREIGVGPSTVRRDLRRLSEGQRLVRTYGGAMVVDRAVGSPPAHATRAMAEKRRVAVAAAGLVRDGQTIAVTSGSTAVEFSHQLVDRSHLTVITNSLDVAQVLLDREGIQLVVLGGVVRPRMHSLLGHLTEQACREMRADTLFMGIGAISLERGLMNDYMPEILTDRALRSIATSVVVMADSGKFDLVAPALVFGLDEVDVIVTDSGVRAEVVADLTARDIRVIVA
jgi:DeoR family transcriptional regulator, aga operon transcriptional repressor